ncbi:hypothetical protein Barb6_01267 [Bacteroidales bacterium Barb6]|nr:hypothetical protein Barb6_01267 [Bacteroidales bacterium Barb6]
MKKNVFYILSIILLSGTSCTDVLDQKAVDSFNEEVVFSDINIAKAYLGSCYRRMGGSGDEVCSGCTATCWVQ